MYLQRKCFMKGGEDLYIVHYFITWVFAFEMLSKSIQEMHFKMHFKSIQEMLSFHLETFEGSIIKICVESLGDQYIIPMMDIL